MYYQPNYTQPIYASSPNLQTIGASPRGNGAASPPAALHQSFSYIPQSFISDLSKIGGFGFDPSAFVNQVVALSALGHYAADVPVSPKASSMKESIPARTPKKAENDENYFKREDLSTIKKQPLETVSVTGPLRFPDSALKPPRDIHLPEAVTNTHSPMATAAPAKVMFRDRKDRAADFCTNCFGWLKKTPAEKTPAQRF